MNEVSTASLLNQLNRLSERVDAEKLLNGIENTVSNTNSFADVMKDTLSAINDQQMKAGAMGTEYQLGNKDIDTAKLMIEIQKARVSFEALNQVRNQVVSAYQDVMNMQV